MANGMAGLYIGVSGLKSSQTALNTVAHNLSNINTAGYTRQQIAFSTAQYTVIGQSATQEKSFGIGVDIAAIRRVRDELIDAAYRQENGRLGYYGSQYDAITEIESLFGEMNGVTFSESMTSFKNALTALATEPESTIKRSALIQMASTFIDTANSVYSGLKKYQTTLNTQVTNMVNKINTLGSTISDLNQKIVAIEARGEHANDLRDQRDAALDELSGYIKVTYEESANGTVTVTAEGVSFVTPSGYNQMGMQTVEGTNLVTPTWPSYDNRTVFNDYERITAIDNNDIGELKGLLLARGNCAVSYKDVPVEPSADDYEGGAASPEYLAAYAEYEDKCEFYNKYIEPSVILTTMASLDKLVNGIVTSMNDILCPPTTYDSATILKDADGNDITGYEEITDASGNKIYRYSILDTENTGVGMDEDHTIGTELFSRTGTERYKQSTITNADGTTTTLYVFNDKNTAGVASDYTLGNLSINSVASQHIDRIPLSAGSVGQEGEDFDRAQALVDAWDEDFAAVNPSKYAKENFTEFYNSLVGQFADEGSVLGKLVSYQSTMVSGYDSQRAATETVSSDEELQNMIKYQQAYNAASRYVNVVSEMLEHIIERLGS